MDTNGTKAMNPIYMDMLDFLIDNKGDIQNFTEEYSGLQKIAEDTIEAVQHLFSDQERSGQVVKMIRAYIRNLNERDL